MSADKSMDEPVKTAVLYGKKDIRIEDRPPPVCSGRDLIVKPEAVGICGTDFSYFTKCAINGKDIPFPEVHDMCFGGILGHEALDRVNITLPPPQPALVEAAIAAGAAVETNLELELEEIN